jgi:hypothetical protein
VLDGPDEGVEVLYVLGGGLLGCVVHVGQSLVVASLLFYERPEENCAVRGEIYRDGSWGVGCLSADLFEQRAGFVLACQRLPVDLEGSLAGGLGEARELFGGVPELGVQTFA